MKTMLLTKQHLLVHVTSPNMEACQKHTASSYREMVEILEGLKRDPTTTADAFDKAQQILGITYDPTSLVFDKRLREIAGIPDAIFWDWQHCLLSSGGVAQYGINQFLRAVVGFVKGHALIILHSFHCVMSTTHFQLTMAPLHSTK